MTSTEPAERPPFAPGRFPIVLSGRHAIVACILILTGLTSVFAWFEIYPAALVEADAAYRRDDLEIALRLARGHLARRPTSRHATLVAARCLSRLGKPQEAEDYYQKAWPLDREDSHIRAFAWVVNNSRETAIRNYQALLAHWPDDVLALSRLAAVLISESRWSDALDSAGRLIKIPEGAVIGYTLAGVVHSNTGECDETVDEFRQVLRLDPELKRMPLKPRTLFWAHFGKNLLLMGYAEEAERHLHRALEEGNDARIADLLGQAYYLQGMLDEAEQCWRLALQWNPRRYGTWWRLGKLELQRRRPAHAVEPLQHSIEIEPEAVGPLYSLSLAYRLLGRHGESEEFHQRANSFRGKRVHQRSRDPEDASPGTEQGTPSRQLESRNRAEPAVDLSSSL
jgi:tetratricopeptide (TPR) repeat protein